MIDITFIGNTAICNYSSDDDCASFVLTFHPRSKTYSFEKRYSSLTCMSFSRFLNRCMDCVKAYYE